ncbi:alpha/beta fold hydrolase [Porphyromonas sp.]|uniref:alpha/beta fold hydrolase n=1 Tax=Porphyromonas sp. TaxID=1924944 RepID=UPI0026DD9BCD|nr:alpha/beta hydrolase [Porphyromonas sp.]MDO4695877.1 alpha/beta hydrolase [Porphyromonas sp.]MDO4771474.1 alpha/beta hydrolase [Porphyromonas sp.]
MNIYEFGSENSKTLLFFQGSCTCWRDYMPSIKLLARRLHVIVPVIEGHDPMEKGDFISVEKTVSEVSDYLLKKGYKELAGVYGLSFGGSMALRMLAEQRITIHKAILDGAITPYELPRCITRLILLRDYCMVRVIQSSMFIFKLLATPDRWTPKGSDGKARYRGMYPFLRGLSRKTIWNVFDSANNYKMPQSIPPLATEIQFWYGSLEKRSRKKDFRWLSKHLHKVHTREFPKMEHGELVMMHPEEFSQEVSRFLLSDALS